MSSSISRYTCHTTGCWSWRKAGAGANYMAGISGNHRARRNRLSADRSVPRPTVGRERRLVFRKVVSSAAHVLVLQSAGHGAELECTAGEPLWTHHVRLLEQFLQNQPRHAASVGTRDVRSAQIEAVAAGPSQARPGVLEIMRWAGIDPERIEFVDRAARERVTWPITTASIWAWRRSPTTGIRPRWIRCGWVCPSLRSSAGRQAGRGWSQLNNLCSSNWQPIRKPVSCTRRRSLR